MRTSNKRSVRVNENKIPSEKDRTNEMGYKRNGSFKRLAEMLKLQRQSSKGDFWMNDLASCIEKRKFEDSERSRRRGIVISKSTDQMESMVIEPGTENAYVFRVSVQLQLR